MVGWVTGVHLHDHNCGMKAYRAAVVREISLYGEMHRFVPILAAARGFKVGELAIQHRPRKFGHSKYRWQRFIKGFLDLGTVHFLTRFGRRPQHLLGSYGLAGGFLAVVGALCSALLAGLGWYCGENWAVVLSLAGLAGSLTLLVVAAQFLLAGLLAELIVARQLMEQDPYQIIERTPNKVDPL
jgi:dolichol-phosphate mannosyltransferase